MQLVPWLRKRQSACLIVVDDLSTLDEVEPRLVNDYGILVGPNGVEQIYKM